VEVDLHGKESNQN